MFSTSPWESPHWFRRQHFALRLARNGWNVFYVNPLQTMTTAFRSDPLQAFARVCCGASRTEDQAARLVVHDPPLTLPLLVRSPCMGRLGRRLVRTRLHRAARLHFASGPYVQVAYNPCDRDLLVTGEPVLYDVIDVFSAYPELRRQRAWVETCDQALTLRADSVVATSAELAARHGAAARLTVIGNGVDLKHYLGSRDASEPADLARLPHPRVVYVGALTDWFDFALLSAQAQLFPRVSFVLLGFFLVPPPPLPANVYYLGHKRWQDLPAYLWHCDAGMIPFKIDELTLHVNPLKFYEYVACDLPTVSTRMHVLSPFEAPGVLTLADNAATFADGLRLALNDNRATQARRRAIAEAHGWDRLAHDFDAAATAVLESRIHAGA